MAHSGCFILRRTRGWRHQENGGKENVNFIIELVLESTNEPQLYQVIIEIHSLGYLFIILDL